jgi:hypothetical protein
MVLMTVNDALRAQQFVILFTVYFYLALVLFTDKIVCLPRTSDDVHQGLVNGEGVHPGGRTRLAAGEAGD